jgi:GTPase SAR1 family protein
MLMQVNEYKVSLVGPPNLGKTLFVKRLVRNSNDLEYYDYIPTLGADIYPLELNGIMGKIRLNIWDCAGDSRYRGLGEKYNLDTKVAIVFRKSNDESYLEFENELPVGTMCEFIEDYNLTTPEKSVSEYKQMLYNFIINISF